MTPKETAKGSIIEPENWMEAWCLRRGKDSHHWWGSWKLSLLIGVLIVFFFLLGLHFYPSFNQPLSIMVSPMSFFFYFILIIWIFTTLMALERRTYYTIIQRLVEREKKTGS